MSDDRPGATILLALLEGATFANAVRSNGRPCRIRLPDDPESRVALIRAHLSGAPSTLTFHAEGYEPWEERVDAVTLAAFCPAADGRCRWVAVDLDASDHGASGLCDPCHATRVIAERAAHAGLGSGMLVTRSRRGCGRHVFVLLSEPVSLADAVIGVAALAAAAFRIAAFDVANNGAQNAFRRVNGPVARPGDAGAVELLPHSSQKPPHGWALALPAAGAAAPFGGGVIVDPFEDQPTRLGRVPRCDHVCWTRFVDEAKATLSKRNATAAPLLVRRPAKYTHRSRSPIDRIDRRTQAFLEGRVTEGARNTSAFAASANLLGCGVDQREAEFLIVAGATTCGLPEREARNAFNSAVRAVGRRKVST